jgi:hypothetical protein
LTLLSAGARGDTDEQGYGEQEAHT